MSKFLLHEDNFSCWNMLQFNRLGTSELPTLIHNFDCYSVWRKAAN